jgi:hypothetical protein
MLTKERIDALEQIQVTTQEWHTEKKCEDALGQAALAALKAEVEALKAQLRAGPRKRRPTGKGVQRERHIQA